MQVSSGPWILVHWPAFPAASIAILMFTSLSTSRCRAALQTPPTEELQKSVQDWEETVDRPYAARGLAPATQSPTEVLPLRRVVVPDGHTVHGGPPLEL
jgi:hypothetical protein